MKRIAWASDIHLNFVNTEQIKSFCRTIDDAAPNALLITGDIGESSDLEQYLLILTKLISTPIYFVLGNHDYYGGSIAEVRQRVESLSMSVPALTWLPVAGIVALTQNTCLVGHDGWADGRLGDYTRSRVMINDYRLISDLRDLDKEERLKRLNVLGDEGADFFREILPEALANFHYVLVATHVPPFRSSCWHEGKISSDDYLPHFSCKAVGEVLEAFMRKHPDRQMTVLCGHTHSGGEAQILPNLIIKTGEAVYGRPKLNEIIDVL